MATITDLVTRTRLEIGDESEYFEDTVLANGLDRRIAVPHYPLDATTVVVKVDGVTADVSTYVVEEWNGNVIFNTAPAHEAVVLVTGSKWRVFTQTDLTTIVTDAVNMHTRHRVDSMGRAVTLANLDPIEVYPISLLAAWMAGKALANDAALDIDIQTPDGVSIPRSQRFRQLIEMADERYAMYNDLCLKLNVGLNAIEIFTLRKRAKSTNRLIPVYRDQEVDDRTMPERVFVPIPTDGADHVPDDGNQLDLVIDQSAVFSQTLTFTQDITTYSAQAQIRLFPGAPQALAQFVITPVDAHTLTISLPASVTKFLPLQAYWDLFVYPTATPATTSRWYDGRVLSPRSITEPSGVLPSLPGGSQPPLLSGTAQGGFTALSAYNGQGQGS